MVFAQNTAGEAEGSTVSGLAYGRCISQAMVALG